MQSNFLLYILVLGVVALQGCQSSGDPWPYAYTDWENFGLKGKVKSVVKKAYGVDSSGTQMDTNDLFGHEEKQFSPDGFMTKEILSADKNTQLGYSIFRYEQKKNRIIEMQYSLSDEKQGKAILELDDKGQNTEVTVFNRNGDFDYRRTFVFDSTNRILGDAIEIKNYSKTPEHLTTIEKRVYDIHGNLTEEALLSKGRIRWHNVSEYDSAGHLTRLIRRLANDEILDTLTYQYRFDSIGNWVWRRIYHNGKLNSVVKRKIEYY